MTRIILICVLFIIASTCKAQKYALIDRDFKKPLLFTDSVTINQVSSNYFPVRVDDLDSLNANLEYIKSQLTDVQRSKLKSYKLKSGNTEIQVNTISLAYGDAYDILLITKANNVNAEYLISSNKSLNKRAKKNISSFLEFIKKDKDIIIKEFKDFAPVLLDATVYIPSKS